jgi:UDP:flavonoid glycosyltransferase YjiC (YdhE family)
VFEGQFSPHGTLALFSRLLAEPQPDWPPNVHVTGAAFHAGPAAMPAELEAFLAGGPPPLVFTLGSSAVGAAGAFYHESAEAARRLGMRAVLLVGRDPANRPPALSPDAIAVEYAPHGELFPRAAAVVHQGGAGTLALALRSGRPMVVVPYAHDQPDNAHRAARLGVARVVYPRRYTARRVADALRALLTHGDAGRRAAEVGAAVRAERGAAGACDVLEQVASAVARRVGSDRT